ncbi:MAG TPA: hypothetical protein VGN34_07065 [Ktedonobacteraceae bacterium]|jgi:hypothetical protein
MIKGNNFENIAQEIMHLQQRMAALRAENTDLRQQLTNLRSGRNILIEIAGKRFSFSYGTTDAAETPAKETVSVTEAPAEKVVAAPTLPEQPSTPPIQMEPSSPISSTAEVPLDYPTTPRIKAQQDGEKDETQNAEKKNQARPSTFLEEIMLDEFAAAASTPLAVWTGPLKKPEPISEDQKEALRRELMGSFLLE